MEVLQSQTNLSSVELRPLCSELTPLDVQHQITTTDILHDKVYSCLSLETCVEIQQEWMPLLVGDKEDSLFRSRAFDFVVLDDEFLLEHLDGVKLLGCLGFCKHDLSEVALTQDCEEVEMVESYPSS